MAWIKRKKLYQGKNKNYSIIKKLRKENKSSEEFEIKINNLTLEELIGLKLELASNSAGGTLYGLPLWHSMTDIVKEAVFKYAVSATRTKGEAIRFLGVTPSYFRSLYKKFNIDDYFNNGGDWIRQGRKD